MLTYKQIIRGTNNYLERHVGTTILFCKVKLELTVEEPEIAILHFQFIRNRKRKGINLEKRIKPGNFRKRGKY